MDNSLSESLDTIQKFMNNNILFNLYTMEYVLHKSINAPLIPLLSTIKNNITHIIENIPEDIFIMFFPKKISSRIIINEKYDNLYHIHKYISIPSYYNLYYGADFVVLTLTAIKNKFPLIDIDKYIITECSFDTNLFILPKKILDSTKIKYINMKKLHAHLSATEYFT